MSNEKRRKGAKLLRCLFYVLFLGILAAGVFAQEETGKSQLQWSCFQEPAKEYRPLVRWWWPGNDVEDNELKREVDLLAENWFGGAEIQPFEAALGKMNPEEMARVQSVDTESFFQHLAAAMEEAKTKGLILDLTLGSGWPSGGSQIQPEQAIKTMFWGETELTGPTGKIAIPVPAPRKPHFYQLSGILKYVAMEASVRFMPEKAELITVIAGRVVGGKRSQNPLNLADTIDLDPSSIQALGNQVDAKGNIYWQVPEGKWRIISIYLAPDGQYLSLSASPEPAFVADHFDAELFRSNLEHLLGERAGLNKYYGAPLRAFFNDSFELKTERFFTKDFLYQFQNRRGYDLTPFLPAVLIPGADNVLFTDGGLKTHSAFTLSPEDRRIQYDYQLTVSDLFLERFIDNAASWAEARGLASRVQAYGLNIDSIKAYGHSQIPETEQLYAGGYEVFLKMASSAAHLYNRSLITSESMVWMAKPYQSTPLKLKASADKLLSSGINQIIYHGFPYQKKDPRYGETGWYPWGSGFSENISEANPFWRFIPELNKYISRCQYALRQGNPEADLLIYYPFFGFPTSFEQSGKEDELLFNGEFDGEPKSPINSLVAIGSKILPMGPDERAKWRAQVRPLLRELEDNGYSWDWVNDDSLLEAKSEAGKIALRGNEWKALLIVNIEALPPETASKISGLAKDGTAVLIIGKPPARQPGYKNYLEGDRKVQAEMKNALACDRAKNIDPSSALKALLEIQVQPGIAFDQPTEVRHLRRRIAPGSQIIFLRNPVDSSAKFNFAVFSGCENAQWLDAWKGYRYGARMSGKGMIEAELPAYGSMILACGMEIPPGEIKSFRLWPENLAGAAELEIKNWNLSVSGSEVKGKSVSLDLDQLKDWREIEPLKYCSSPGVYRSEFDLQALKPGQKAVLEIKWVYGAAEVKINDQPAGNLLIPPFRLEIGRYLVPGKNKIEITLTPALRNRLVGQSKGKENQLIPTGLIGPIGVRSLISD